MVTVACCCHLHCRTNFHQWKYSLSKTVSEHKTVLALATQGDVTRNRNNPFCIAPPKVPKASTDLCDWGWHYHTHFANGNMAFIYTEYVRSYLKNDVRLTILKYFWSIFVDTQF